MTPPKARRHRTDRRQRDDGPPEKKERRSGHDRRDSFDPRYIRRSKQPFRTAFYSIGVYFCFAISVLACVVASTIPGPPRLNHIPMSIVLEEQGICVCDTCLDDITDDDTPDEEPPPEEVQQVTTEEEGEGELEKKKKKKPPTLDLSRLLGTTPKPIGDTGQTGFRPPPPVPAGPVVKTRVRLRGF